MACVKLAVESERKEEEVKAWKKLEEREQMNEEKCGKCINYIHEIQVKLNRVNLSAVFRKFANKITDFNNHNYHEYRFYLKLVNSDEEINSLKFMK